MSTWDDPAITFHEDGTIDLEFDYTGFNNRHYHYPPTEIDFDDFLTIYDELQFWGIEFEVESG